MSWEREFESHEKGQYEKLEGKSKKQKDEQINDLTFQRNEINWGNQSPNSSKGENTTGKIVKRESDFPANKYNSAYPIHVLYKDQRERTLEKHGE